MLEHIFLRSLVSDDYNKGYLSLLEELTEVNQEKITPEIFNAFVAKLNKEHFIMVIEDLDDKKIIASGTLFVEPKLIHGASSVGHIEDVVVTQALRGKHLGMQIVQKLTKLAQEAGCYKVILDADLKNQPFYQKCGFKEKERQMVHYY